MSIHIYSWVVLCRESYINKKKQNAIGYLCYRGLLQEANIEETLKRHNSQENAVLPTTGVQSTPTLNIDN